MWFSLDGKEPEHVALEEVLARLEAIVRFADDLEHRFGDAGLGRSLGDVIGLYRKLKTTLEAIPTDEIARALEGTRELIRGLATLERGLDELTRLKALLGA